MKKDIFIILPYKENFSKKKSGAVSLFVNDILKNTLNKKDRKKRSFILKGIK